MCGPLHVPGDCASQEHEAVSGGDGSVEDGEGQKWRWVFPEVQIVLNYSYNDVFFYLQVVFIQSQIVPSGAESAAVSL